MSPRDAGSFLLDAGGARTHEGASVKRTRSVRSEPARAPAGDRSRCGFAQQIRRRPTAPRRHKVANLGWGQKDCLEPPRKLRWNSSCLGRLPAHLGTISPQLICQLPHFSMEKRGLLPLFPRETLGRPNLYRLKDCPKLPAGKERPQVPAVELRWNRDCLGLERTILIRISPQVIGGG